MATPVIMPRQGQSVESCILVEWLVSEGDTVSEGQSLANIETDKAVFEVESPAAGTVLALFFPEGEDIPVLTNIAAIGDAGEDASGLAPDGSAPAAPAAAAAPEAASAPAEAKPAEPAPAAPVAAPAAPAAAPATGTSPASPRARNRAAEVGIDAGSLPGTGPQGRVIERDVQAAAAAGPALSPAAVAAMAGGGLAPPAAGSGPGGRVLTSDLQPAGSAPAAPAAPAVLTEVETVPVSGIRKIIAERMHQSLSTTAQLTLTTTFDASALQAYRAQVKDQGEKLGLPNITLNDMIAFATAQVLRRHPELNAHFLGDRILRYPNVNLGIAMDTPRGLMVPVLANADRLSLRGVSEALKPLIDSAKAGTVNPDLLQGGTFTITNMGMLGIESFTPVLNAPEVAILGVGGLSLQPVRRKGEIVYIDAMHLSLTIDHQATDGAPGARFLQDLAATLENFSLALA